MGKVAPTQQPPLPQQQQNQQGFNFKCPRCDSSNTKFCYYNNYSLSQPRHYCKACKRYWTRGGTLRNVPVGGRCRKNERPKRPSNSSLLEGPNNVSLTSTGNTTIASSANPSCNSSQTQMDLFPSASNHINPLLLGVTTNPSELNIPFPMSKFNTSSRVSSTSMDGFDQLNAFGLGFSSSNLIMSSTSSNTSVVMATANTSIPLLPSYSSIFGSSSSSLSPSPTMAALLASSFLQQRVSAKETTTVPLDHFQTSTITPLEGMQMDENSESRDLLKGVKVEHAGQSNLDWNLTYQNHQVE